MTSNISQPSSAFEILRQELLSEISLSFEHVLTNINKLNRSLEGVISVGHEFSSVEALWATFEDIMAKDVPDPPQAHASDPPAAPDERLHSTTSDEKSFVDPSGK